MSWPRSSTTRTSAVSCAAPNRGFEISNPGTHAGVEPASSLHVAGTSPSVPLIYGAGAIGCYLGGRLATVGPVRLLGRAAIVGAIETRGLTLRLPDGDLVTRPAAGTDATVLPQSDLIFLTVRAGDVAPAIPDLQRLLTPNGHLVALQNGAGSDEGLIAALGRERVVVATLTTRVTMVEPGVVTQDSRSGGVALADPVPDDLIRLLQSAGLSVVTVPDARSLRWSKLLLNLLGAGTTAILDEDIATVLADPALFRLDQLLIREVGRVMDAAGIRTVSLPSYPVPLVRLAMRLPRPLAQRLLAPRIGAARGGKSPTARSDLQRGRSELPWFYDPIVRLGAEYRVRTPISAALSDLVSALLADPELRQSYRGQVDQLLVYLRERGISL